MSRELYDVHPLTANKIPHSLSIQPDMILLSRAPCSFPGTRQRLRLAGSNLVDCDR